MIAERLRKNRIGTRYEGTDMARTTGIGKQDFEAIITSII